MGEGGPARLCPRPVPGCREAAQPVGLGFHPGHTEAMLVPRAWGLGGGHTGRRRPATGQAAARDPRLFTSHTEETWPGRQQ